MNRVEIKPRYQQLKDDQPLHVSRYGARIACCDCGLVHDMEIKKRLFGVDAIFRRNEKATGQARRRKNKFIVDMRPVGKGNKGRVGQISGIDAP